MSKWEYTGAGERDFLYPVAMTVNPGDIVEADENPGPGFFDEHESQPGATAEETDEKE